MLPGYADWMYAFSELCTERRYEGGPIPRSAILDYTREWEPSEAQIFYLVMREMDQTYTRHGLKDGNTYAEVPEESTNPARDSFRAAMGKGRGGRR